MAIKRPKPEEFVLKIRRVEVLKGQYARVLRRKRTLQRLAGCPELSLDNREDLVSRTSISCVAK